MRARRWNCASRYLTPPSTAVLGADIQAGQRPQIIIPKDHWQSARSIGAWTIVGCTVAPGFEF